MEWIQVDEGRWRLVDPKVVRDDGPSAPFVRNERLSPKAKRTLEIQTGRKFDSESSVRAYLKDNNLRIVEGGENRKRRDWIKNTKPGDRGRYEGPVNRLGYGITE